MPIAIFFFVFSGAIVIALLYPHLRVLAVAAALLCAVLLGVLFYDHASAPERQATALTPGDIALSDVALIAEPRYLKLAGWVENKSAVQRVRDFNLRTKLYDCPTEDAELSDCAVIGEQDGIARVDLPPSQTRTFEAVLGFTSSNTARGVLRWEYEVTSVRATDPRP